MKDTCASSDARGTYSHACDGVIISIVSFDDRGTSMFTCML